MNRPTIPSRFRSLGDTFHQRVSASAIIMKEALSMPDVRAGKVIASANDGFVHEKPSTPAR